MSEDLLRVLLGNPFSLSQTITVGKLQIILPLLSWGFLSSDGSLSQCWCKTSNVSGFQEKNKGFLTLLYIFNKSQAF